MRHAPGFIEDAKGACAIHGRKCCLEYGFPGGGVRVRTSRACGVQNEVLKGSIERLNGAAQVLCQQVIEVFRLPLPARKSLFVVLPEVDRKEAQHGRESADYDV